MNRSINADEFDPYCSEVQAKIMGFDRSIIRKKEKQSIPKTMKEGCGKK